VHVRVAHVHTMGGNTGLGDQRGVWVGGTLVLGLTLAAASMAKGFAAWMTKVAHHYPASRRQVVRHWFGAAGLGQVQTTWVGDGYGVKPTPAVSSVLPWRCKHPN